MRIFIHTYDGAVMSCTLLTARNFTHAVMSCALCLMYKYSLCKYRQTYAYTYDVVVAGSEVTFELVSRLMQSKVSSILSELQNPLLPAQVDDYFYSFHPATLRHFPVGQDIQNIAAKNN